METAPKNIDKENKPKPSLIPMDLLIKVLEPGYREGIIKYYRESWRIGFKTSDMYDGAIRHLTTYFYDGEDYDPDAVKLGINKLHLGGALFCILCMADTFLNHPEMDDRGKDYRKIEVPKNELYQCPYSKAVTCTMDEPCNGCETWAWAIEKEHKPVSPILSTQEIEDHKKTTFTNALRNLSSATKGENNEKNSR